MGRWLTRPSLVVLVLATAVTAATAGTHAASRHEASYAYGGGPRRGLDAYWNDAQTPQPALLILHGGYWHSGDKADWATTARYFADNGFAVFSADYRHNTEAAWPGPRDDAVAAVGWIKAHAAEFGVDPAHVAVLGSQGGGQLATALAAYGAGRDRVNAAVALSPVNSPYRAWSDAPTGAAAEARRAVRDEAVILNRCHPSAADTTCWARWTDGDTTAQASGADDAPMYLVHSAGDVVPAAHSTDLRDAEVAKGMNAADTTVRTVAGTGTGGSLFTTAVRDEVLAWLKARTRSVPPAATNPVAASAPSPRTPAPRPVIPNDDPVGRPPAAGAEARAAVTAVTTGTYAYGADPKQRLDAYHAPAAAKRPALVIIHGGYWYANDKADWAGAAQWYAQRGYAVFAVNYRLNKKSGWTAQRTDALNALAWIRANAAAFAVDPARVLLLGSSAGGHIATSVGTYGTGKNRVRGVVALSPVASPYRAYNDGQRPAALAAQRKLRDNATLLARCHPTRTDAACWRRWSDTVVKTHASAGDAPMFLLHSQGDFVPSAHSADLCAALTAANVSCTLHVIAGNPHGGAILGTAGTHTTILTWLRAHD